jgi:hypothetical protein
LEGERRDREGWGVVWELGNFTIRKRKGVKLFQSRDKIIGERAMGFIGKDIEGLCESSRIGSGSDTSRDVMNTFYGKNPRDKVFFSFVRLGKRFVFSFKVV